MTLAVTQKMKIRIVHHKVVKVMKVKRLRLKQKRQVQVVRAIKNQTIKHHHLVLIHQVKSRVQVIR